MAVIAVRVQTQQSLCYARKAQICVRVLLLCLLLLCWLHDDGDRGGYRQLGRLADQPALASVGLLSQCGSGQQWPSSLVANIVDAVAAALSFDRALLAFALSQFCC
jgi:hypothetical protein